MNVMYVHGYGGSENGSSSQLVKKVLNEYYDDVKVFAPEIPLKTKGVIKFINDFVKDNNIDLIIASSLGAFFTIGTYDVVPKIVINPALPENLVNLGVDFADFEEGYYEYISNLANDYLSSSDMIDEERRGSTYLYLVIKII